MSEEMEFYLNPNSGYISVPRALAEHLLQNINLEDATALYYYLLLSANYAQCKTPKGVTVRGEVDCTIAQIATKKHDSYGRIRRMMKELEADGLVIYINKNGRRHIFLPYYEEHCGRKVRPVEQAEGPIHSQNQTDKDFDLFWEFYHEMIPVTPQDRAKARKIYGRLSLNDRESAVRNVEVYYASLASEKHAKWAVNYLKDKSFIMDKKA